VPEIAGTGISFSDIMMLATAITVLVALSLSIVSAVGSSSNLNVLSIPGNTAFAFNTLWFDNFDFFNSKGKSCGAIVTDVREMGGTDFLGIVSGIFWVIVHLIAGCGIGGLRLVIGLGIASYWGVKLIQVMGSFAQILNLFK
jgi:hypothetical protein